MARRYLIDSILYWAKEYHIDGFRFDLMGLYDAESINAVRAALDSLPAGGTFCCTASRGRAVPASCTGTSQQGEPCHAQRTGGHLLR